MLNAFQTCFTMGVFLACQRAETATGQGAGPEKYRAILLEKLAEAEQRLKPHWGTETAGAARRMLTVWLDEILIESPWPGQKQWLYTPLQSEWGEGRSGGAWFFQYLENLNAARRDDRELAALALRCISLGLRGSYGRAPDRLDQLRQDIQARFSFHDQAPIFPPPLPPDARKKTSASLFAVKLLAVVAAILAILGLTTSFGLEQELSAVTLTPEGL